MESYKVELSSAAERDLKSLPQNVRKEIVMTHLSKIQKNPFGEGRPLAGASNKERSYHFGRRPEYRIIYFLEGHTITVTVIGTREVIYKKAKRRR